MHSKIFQITEHRVPKDKWLNEDTLAQGDNTDYDYCGEITGQERKESIAYLVNDILPKGMFTLAEDDTLIYKGGAEQWKRDYIDLIHRKADDISTDNLTDWIGPVYKLEKALKNPLDTAYRFYMDEDGWQTYAEQSYEFMCMVCRLKEGDTLHIGGVIDYHF